MKLFVRKKIISLIIFLCTLCTTSFLFPGKKIQPNKVRQDRTPIHFFDQVIFKNEATGKYLAMQDINPSDIKIAISPYINFHSKWVLEKESAREQISYSSNFSLKTRAPQILKTGNNLILTCKFISTNYDRQIVLNNQKLYIQTNLKNNSYISVDDQGNIELNNSQTPNSLWKIIKTW